MEEISLDLAIEEFIDYKVSKLYTALPCRVVSVRVSLEDQRVDLQPLTNKKLKDGTEKEQPTILNVPLMFPSSKKASVTFPVDVGDVVLCVFAQRSLDAFKASTGAKTYTPRDNRKLDITDAIAIPGLFPFKDAINDPAKRKWSHSTRDMVMVNNIGQSTENEVRLKENGNIEVKTDQDFYATFNDGLVECRNLTINATQSVTIDAGTTIDIISGGDTTLNSSANTNITVANDLAVDAATWNVTIGGTTTVNCPTTNWTGNFNLTGAFGLAGPLTAAGGGGGGDTAVINMPLNVNESVTVSGGDVTADGISLKSHTHSDPQGGTVGPPQ